jgi:peptidoglycan/LPS O-acetylase OafA/YrhL
MSNTVLRGPALSSGGKQVYRVFGSYRFVLALLVLVSHASMWLGHDVGILALGNVGVMSFFVLSGFVIAEALYVFYRDSILRFAANRFLKLYPTYWVAAALAVPAFAYAGHPLLVSPLSVATNLTIILGHLKFANNLLFVSVAWAVIVELFFYAIFAAFWFAARGRGISVAVAAMLFLLCYVGIAATDSYTRGFSFLRHAPYFVLGASYYWTMTRRRLPIVLLTAVALAFALHSYFVYNSANPEETTIGSLLLFCVSLAMFAGLAFTRASNAFKTLDRKLGDYTYAVYLVHWVVIEVVATLALPDFSKFLVALLGSVALAVLINVAVERPLVQIRTRVRGQALYGS